MSSVWNTALNILARREHSEAELVTKLRRKFPEDPAQVDEVISRLQEQGLQSDERYTDMWVRSQLMKGRGPIRIKAEAKQRGVSERVDHYLETLEHDWFEAALEVASRKFSPGITFEQQAKVYRFLAYRGFSSDSIRYVVDTLLAESTD